MFDCLGYMAGVISASLFQSQKVDWIKLFQWIFDNKNTSETEQEVHRCSNKWNRPDVSGCVKMEYLLQFFFLFVCLINANLSSFLTFPSLDGLLLELSCIMHVCWIWSKTSGLVFFHKFSSVWKTKFSLYIVMSYFITLELALMRTI
jgi:hypothetical protein